MDYMFPGSDDDLGMEDMDDTDELDRQRESGDTKLVYVMSTNSSPSASTTVKRRAKDGSVADISCPENTRKCRTLRGRA